MSRPPRIGIDFAPAFELGTRAEEVVAWDLLNRGARLMAARAILNQRVPSIHCLDPELVIKAPDLFVFPPAKWGGNWARPFFQEVKFRRNGPFEYRIARTLNEGMNLDMHRAYVRAAAETRHSVRVVFVHEKQDQIWTATIEALDAVKIEHPATNQIFYPMDALHLTSRKWSTLCADYLAAGAPRFRVAEKEGEGAPVHQ